MSNYRRLIPYAGSDRTSRANEPWTDEETRTLIEAHIESNGNWAYVMSKLQGRTRGAVYAKFHHEGRPLQAPPKIPPGPAAERTDLTGILMGDPQPGRSALELRQAPRGITLASHA